MEQAYPDILTNNMQAQFVRGGLNTRKDILDRVLNRIITIEMVCANVRLTPNKTFDLKDEDTKFFADELKKAKVKYEIGKEETSQGEVYVTISGPKESWLKILPMWDASGRDEKELAKELKNWDGDEDELWEVIC